MPTFLLPPGDPTSFDSEQLQVELSELGIAAVATIVDDEVEVVVASTPEDMDEATVESMVKEAVRAHRVRPAPVDPVEAELMRINSKAGPLTSDERDVVLRAWLKEKFGE